MVGRAAALLTLGTALGLYYAFHDRLWEASDWWDIAFLGLVLIPACFALVWFVLPWREARGLLPVGLALCVLAWALHEAGWNGAENFAKLIGISFLGFWFLQYFETLSWVVLVSLIIPWVDAFSVFSSHGPTHKITEEHPEVFTAFSFAFPIPGGRRLREPRAARSAVLRIVSRGVGAVRVATWVDMALHVAVVRCHARARCVARPRRTAGTALAGCRVPRRERRPDLGPAATPC